MTQINLLPWREHKRQQEKRAFLRIVITCSMAAVFLILALNYGASKRVSNQQLRNHMLQQEIAVYDRKIRTIKTLDKNRGKLISQISVVQKLLSRRMLLVHLFDELTRVVPSGIYLTQVEGKGNVISVLGYAESNADVSLQLQNIEQNEWFHNPILKVVKNAQEKYQPTRNGFKLTFILRSKLSLGTLK